MLLSFQYKRAWEGHNCSINVIHDIYAHAYPSALLQYIFLATFLFCGHKHSSCCWLWLSLECSKLFCNCYRLFNSENLAFLSRSFHGYCDWAIADILMFFSYSSYHKSSVIPAHRKQNQDISLSRKDKICNCYDW